MPAPQKRPFQKRKCRENRDAQYGQQQQGREQNGDLQPVAGFHDTPGQTGGGARPGDRTMLDALVPAVDAWAKSDLAAAARAARTGADATASMTRARAGRSVASSANLCSAVSISR